jgi:uncharacterized protein YneF (UPF0154 family)
MMNILHLILKREIYFIVNKKYMKSTKELEDYLAQQPPDKRKEIKSLLIKMKNKDEKINKTKD